MEGAPLRPVPLRPAGPVDAAAALAHVSSMLPDLDEPARRALALVDLGGEDRATAALRLGLDIAATAAALARARKALRRSMFALPATGWCERAEILISDRMDGELSASGAHRLESHLSNCDRCQEHELRLAQALDTLGRTFAVSAPPRTPQLAPPAPEPQPLAFTPPQLVVVEPVEPPAVEPAPEPPPLEPAAESPSQEPAAESPPQEPAPESPPQEPAPTPPEPEAPPPQPASEDIAAAAEVVTRRLGFRAVTWHFLFLIAVLLAVAVVLVTALALSGVERLL